MASKYSMVIAVAKRAKQIREGAPVLVESTSTNPIVIAMEEIAAGKVSIIVPTAEQVEAAERERRGLGPVERPAAPPVAELLRIEPEEEEAEVPGILELEEEDEEEEEEAGPEELLAIPEGLDELDEEDEAEEEAEEE